MRKHAGVLLAALLCGVTAGVQAATLPSLLDGIAVADSPWGVRVASVTPGTPAALGDLRVADVIVRVQQRDVRSVAQFHHAAAQLQGRAARLTLLVFRDGQPRELRLHVYSYPLLQQWGAEFIPDYELRFAEARIGAAHWQRMGRGFEEAQKTGEALNAYLNALHLTPDNAEIAARAGLLWLRVAQERFAAKRLNEGLGALGQASAFLERLFDRPLTTSQLEQLRDQLKATQAALKQPIAN